MQYNVKKEATRLDLQLSEAVLDLAANNQTAIDIGLVTVDRDYKVTDKSKELTEVTNEFIERINSSIRDPKYRKMLISKLLFAYKYAEMDLSKAGEDKILIANIRGNVKFTLMAHLMKDCIYIKTTDEGNGKTINDSIMLSNKHLDDDTNCCIIRSKESSRKFIKDNQLFNEIEQVESYVSYDKDNKMTKQSREASSKLIELNNNSVIIEDNEVTNIKWRCKSNENYILGYAKDDSQSTAYYYIATNDCPSLVNLDCTNSRCVIPYRDFEKYMTGELDVVAKYQDYEKEYTFGFIKSMIPTKKEDSE